MQASDETLAALIADGQARALPRIVPRAVALPDIEGKALALIGMRRSGKTYRLLGEIESLIAAGVPRSRILHLNLEDDRLGRCDADTLDRALEIFYRRDPQARLTRAWIFLDEIQTVPDWERFARRLLDTERVRLVVTGSSARMLSTEVASAFRGRAMTVEVLPYSVEETARAEGLAPYDGPWPPAATRRSQMDEQIIRYLSAGGFPAVRDQAPYDRIQLLQEYVDLVVLRDVAERHGATNLAALRELVAGLFAANTKSFSVSKLHGALTSQGWKVGKPTLLTYLDHLVDAFLFFLVPIRSQSQRQRAANPRKVYAIDPGLAAAMYRAGAENRGAQLENAVYLHLRRRYGRLTDGVVSWYRAPSGREIDFVVDDPVRGGPPHLVQVSESITVAATRAREVDALVEAMHTLETPHATIVTLMDQEQIETDVGPITVVPARRWFFGPDDR